MAFRDYNWYVQSYEEQKQTVAAMQALIKKAVEYGEYSYARIHAEDLVKALEYIDFSAIDKNSTKVMLDCINSFAKEIVVLRDMRSAWLALPHVLKALEDILSCMSTADIYSSEEMHEAYANAMDVVEITKRG